jgi:hypothetical protein
MAWMLDHVAQQPWPEFVKRYQRKSDATNLASQTIQ